MGINAIYVWSSHLFGFYKFNLMVKIPSPFIDDDKVITFLSNLLKTVLFYFSNYKLSAD